MLTRLDEKYIRYASGEGNIKVGVSNENPSPQRQFLAGSTPQSPGAAAKVPLPPSPVKADKPAPLAGPPSATPLASIHSRSQQIGNDRDLHESLAQDFQILNLGPSPEMNKLQDQNLILSPSVPPKSDQPVRKSSTPIKLHEIPPFQLRPRDKPLQNIPTQSIAPPTKSADEPVELSRQQPLQSLSHQTLVSTQQLPPLLQLQQRASTAFVDNAHRKSTDSNASVTFPAPYPNAELTALSGVIVPALEAALRRRSYNLSAAQPQSSRSAMANGSTADDLAIKRQYAHEKLKKLVMKAAGVFAEIEKWDNEAPVGMGEDVNAFLEGFLEEILVRVEAEDE